MHKRRLLFLTSYFEIEDASTVQSYYLVSRRIKDDNMLYKINGGHYDLVMNI